MHRHLHVVPKSVYPNQDRYVVRTLLVLCCVIGMVAILAGRAWGQCKANNAGCRAHAECCSGYCPGGSPSKMGACKPGTSVPTTTPTTSAPTTTEPDLPPRTFALTTSTKPQPTVTTSTKPSVTTTTQPSGSIPPFVMPTGRDLSITLKREQRCKYVAGRTATQVERAAMYVLGTGKLQVEGLLYAKYHPKCAGQVSATAGLEVDDTRLRVFYVDPERNGVWNILSDNGCPDYEHVQTLGEKLQACSTDSDAAKVACAQSKYLNQNILDWTDLRVVNGRCERGGARPVLPPQEDKALARVGMLDYRVPVPFTPPAVAGAMDTIVRIHHRSDHAYCEGGQSAGGFQSALLAMLALTDTPDRRLQHSLLLVFTGIADEGPSGWTRQEVCDWKLLEGIAMHEWQACTTTDPVTRQPIQPLQVWPCRTRTRITHETLHRCAALKNRSKVRIGNHDASPLTGRPSETCEAFLKCQTGETPGCRRAWVPEPGSWRHMVSPVSGPQ